LEIHIEIKDSDFPRYKKMINFTEEKPKYRVLDYFLDELTKKTSCLTSLRITLNNDRIY